MLIDANARETRLLSGFKALNFYPQHELVQVLISPHPEKEPSWLEAK